MDYSVPDDVEDGYQAEWLAENGGVLARTRFYRVIADEAQFIRNRRTRASISMAHVRAQYRWMLTGTPVTNTLCVDPAANRSRALIAMTERIYTVSCASGDSPPGTTGVLSTSTL